MKRKPSPQIQKTIDLVTGSVGVGMVGTIGTTIPGLPGTIITGGAAPIMATGLLEVAGRDYSAPKRRRKKKK